MNPHAIPQTRPATQYPAPVYGTRPDLHNYPKWYVRSDQPVYQGFWEGNRLPYTHIRPYADMLIWARVRSDAFQQVQISKGRPPLSAPAGVVQQMIRRISNAWSALYG